MRAMCGAEQVFPRQVEKVTFLPIEFNRNMRTSIHIPVGLAIISHHKPENVIAMPGQGEAHAQ